MQEKDRTTLREQLNEKEVLNNDGLSGFVSKNTNTTPAPTGEKEKVNTPMEFTSRAKQQVNFASVPFLKGISQIYRAKISILNCKIRWI